MKQFVSSPSVSWDISVVDDAPIRGQEAGPSARHQGSRCGLVGNQIAKYQPQAASMQIERIRGVKPRMLLFDLERSINPVVLIE
jgi:hypothetical protein